MARWQLLLQQAQHIATHDASHIAFSDPALQQSSRQQHETGGIEAGGAPALDRPRLKA
ncbi:MAG: hypothetical protein Q7K57_41360 [Burkholderiaceae bacterium]|nr:hypothetical protein [Burkholderiaceae bacterium]